MRILRRPIARVLLVSAGLTALATGGWIASRHLSRVWGEYQARHTPLVRSLADWQVLAPGQRAFVEGRLDTESNGSTRYRTPERQPLVIWWQSKGISTSRERHALQHLAVHLQGGTVSMGNSDYRTNLDTGGPIEPENAAGVSEGIGRGQTVLLIGTPQEDGQGKPHLIARFLYVGDYETYMEGISNGSDEVALWLWTGLAVAILGLLCLIAATGWTRRAGSFQQ
ncbi:hypothetical protein [Gloeobacter kilaueensis]|uniref:Uncharacterized protein n=1 Tax=Gloeobacter kilaueensis (strain ATCC BAA-2537 / CCAP 1431/1 / ULC 316 / JS1) TaxID=1183438 RepID=U5QQS0_GLOK1|nr:hypothetical protein [Gloeobacter kilaueensis]AGY59969.1 hypothetical protein GKIL_3723 [Gloeobacter kilaueensis JS1]